MQCLNKIKTWTKLNLANQDEVASMIQVNIHETKTNLSKLLEAALRGEEIVIAKAGVPIARIVPIEAEKKKRKPGALKGKIKIAADFDAPLPDDLLKHFEE